MWRCEDEKMICEDERMWRWEGDVWRCEDEKMWRWEGDVCGCEHGKMWRWEDDVCSCEDGKRWRWEDEDVKMIIWEMWRWEDVKMRRCRYEDEKMWRCEDEKIIYRPPLLEEPFAQTLSGKTKTKTTMSSIQFHNFWKKTMYVPPNYLLAMSPKTLPWTEGEMSWWWRAWHRGPPWIHGTAFRRLFSSACWVFLDDIWIHYNDLNQGPQHRWWLVREIIPFFMAARLRWMNYFSLPRWHTLWQFATVCYWKRPCIVHLPMKNDEFSSVLICTDSLRLKITTEIVGLPIHSMVIFYSCLYVYQRVTRLGCKESQMGWPGPSPFPVFPPAHGITIWFPQNPMVKSSFSCVPCAHGSLELPLLFWTHPNSRVWKSPLHPIFGKQTWLR